MDNNESLINLNTSPAATSQAGVGRRVSRRAAGGGTNLWAGGAERGRKNDGHQAYPCLLRAQKGSVRVLGLDRYVIPCEVLGRIGYLSEIGICRRG